MPFVEYSFISSVTTLDGMVSETSCISMTQSDVMEVKKEMSTSGTCVTENSLTSWYMTGSASLKARSSSTPKLFETVMSPGGDNLKKSSGATPSPIFVQKTRTFGVSCCYFVSTNSFRELEMKTICSAHSGGKTEEGATLVFERQWSLRSFSGWFGSLT